MDNLTFDTTPEDIRPLFEKFGTVGDIYIPRSAFCRLLLFSNRLFAALRRRGRHRRDCLFLHKDLLALPCLAPT